jgi:hypothetical protein
MWRASSTYYIGDGVEMPGLQRYFSVDSSTFQEHNLGSTATYYFGPDGTDKGVATVTAFQGGVDIIFRDYKSDLVGKRFYQSAGIMEPAGKPSRFADFDQKFTGASFYEQIGEKPLQIIYTNTILASQGSSVSEIILFTGNQKPFSGYSVKSVIGSSDPGVFYDKYSETLMKPDTTIPPAKVWGIVAADKYCEGSFRRRYPYQGKSRAIPSNSGITKSLGIYKNVSACQKAADADAECGDTIWTNDANCDCMRAGETCTMVDSIMQNSVYQKNPPSLAPLFDYAKEKSCLFAVPAYSWQVKYGGLCNDYSWRGMSTMDALPDEDKCPELCIMGLEYIDDLCAKEDVIGGMNRTAIFDAELNTGLYPTCETPVSQVTETTWNPGPSEAVIVDYSKKYREELLLRFAALPGVSKTCKLFFQEQVVFSVIDTDNNKEISSDESNKAGITVDEYDCMASKDYNKKTAIPFEIFTYFKPVCTKGDIPDEISTSNTCHDIIVGDTCELECNDGYATTAGSKDVMCYSCGTFGSSAPLLGCVKTCALYTCPTGYEKVNKGATTLNDATCCQAPDAPATSGTCADPDAAKGTATAAYICPNNYKAKSNPTGACTDVRTCNTNCCEEACEFTITWTAYGGDETGKITYVGPYGTIYDDFDTCINLENAMVVLAKDDLAKAKHCEITYNVGIRVLRTKGDDKIIGVGSCCHTASVASPSYSYPAPAISSSCPGPCSSFATLATCPSYCTWTGAVCEWQVILDSASRRRAGMPPRLLADDKAAKHGESPLARRLSDDKCGVHSWASIFGNYSGDLNYIAREKQMYGWVTNTTETCNPSNLCGAVPAITRTVRCKRLAVANCDLQKIFGTSKGYGVKELKGAGYSHPTTACTYTDLGEDAQQVVSDSICAVFEPKPSSSVPCPSIPEGDACYPVADDVFCYPRRRRQNCHSRRRRTLSGYTCQTACNWQCYLDRYTDLQSALGTTNTAGAEGHFLSTGKSEGRDCTCSAEPLSCQESLVTVAAKFNAQVAAGTARDAVCHSEDAMGTIAEKAKAVTSASRAIAKCVSFDANDASHGAAGDTDSRRLQTTFIIQIALYLKPSEATQTMLDDYEAALDLTSFPITIEGGIEQTFSITNVAQSFVTFQLSKEPYACPTIPCANQCGEPAVSGPDGYTCVVAGVSISARTCEELEPAIFASKPMTTTVCCPAPDPEYCEPAYQAPTPEPTASPTALDCFGTWMMWGSCSSTCEWGIRSRRYRIITHHEFGGKPCEPKEYKEDCWASKCPVNCEGQWGPWSRCEATCGPGKKSRQYMVTTLGKHGGRKCPENPQMMECNLGVCPFRKPRAEPPMIIPALADNNDVAMALSGAACDPVSSCATEISSYACPISCATTYVAEDYMMDKDQIAFSYYGYGCAGEGDCSTAVFKFLCPQKCAKLEVIAGDKEMMKEKRMQDKAEKRAATKKANKEMRMSQKARAKEMLGMGEKVDAKFDPACKCLGNQGKAAQQSYYPSTMGKFCSQWDMPMDYCMKDGSSYGASWCSSAWCYTSSTCPDAAKGSYFAGLDGPDLFFSYSACSRRLEAEEDDHRVEAAGFQFV